MGWRRLGDLALGLGGEGFLRGTKVIGLSLRSDCNGGLRLGYVGTGGGVDWSAVGDLEESGLLSFASRRWVLSTEAFTKVMGLFVPDRWFVWCVSVLLSLGLLGFPWLE